MGRPLSAKADAAANQAAKYIPYLEFEYPDFEVVAGFRLGQELSTDYIPKVGTEPEYVTIVDTPRPGGILYSIPEIGDPSTSVDPDPPDPFLDFRLPVILNPEPLGERLEEMNDALNRLSYLLDDALNRAAERINDGLNDELNPFDGKNEASLSTALVESGEDLLAAVRESVDGIIDAFNPVPDR